ncbi:MAG: FliH/SctL family protein [Actinomycetota bacterium]|nr:FliH/SctL family protein [Actinomycetota bacterium]
MSRIIRNRDSVKSLSFDRLAYEPGASGHRGNPEALADAQAQAAAIIEKAQVDAAEIKNRAGEEGLRVGMARAALYVAETTQAIIALAQEASEQKWKVIHGAETNIVELALDIAEKLVAEQVKLNPKTVTNIAKKALLLAVEREHIVIRVNSEDLEVMKEAKEDLMCAMDGIQKIELIADRRIRRGGCVIETNAGNIDAGIESQLNEVKQSLRGAIDVD